jgi:hypothetical protein
VEYITKSLNAMIWLAVGATAYALGCLFQLLAAVDQQTNTTFTNVAAWEHGSAWLQFIGVLIITAGVCVAARERPGEALPLALGAALYTAGLAVVAVSGMTTGMRASMAPETARTLYAAGFGVAATVALIHGETKQPTVEQTALWRTAAAGLYVVALGLFFQAHANTVSSGIAALVVSAAGGVAVFAAVATARLRGYLRVPAAPVAVAGVGLAAAWIIAEALVIFLLARHVPSPSSLQAGNTVDAALQLAAAATLAAAAWIQFRT